MNVIRLILKPFVWVRDYVGALNRRQWYIEKEFANAGTLLLSKDITCVDVINKFAEL